MAVSRTPKGRKAAAEPEYTGYFEAMERGSSEKDTGEDGGTQLAEQIAALNARVEALAASNEDLQRANMVLAQTPPQYIPYTEDYQPDNTPLPDPVMDADGFTRGLVSRVDQMVARDLAANRDEQNAVNQEMAAYTGLWNEFAANPDYAPWAEDPDKVEFAAVKVGKRMKDRGVDVNRYMFNYRDQFFSDVVQELNTLWPQGQGEGEEEETDEDVDRTEGIFGGQQAPVTRPIAKASKEGPDLLSDLSEIQRKTGFY